MNGLTIRRTPGRAISVRYAAVSTPRGTAMQEARAVPAREPISRGKIPNSGGSAVGYQNVPNKNAPME